MRPSPKTPEEQAQLVTRLVDGAVGEGEREEAERILRAEPELAAEVERQRRVAQALATAGPDPPERLVAHVRRRVEGEPAPRVRWTARVAVAGALAAAAVAIVVILTTGSSGGRPSIPAAARLAYAPSTGPAPAMTAPRFIGITYAGITFPNYARRFGAVPTGQRTDRIGGRAALTVFYRLRDGARLSYTVFSGAPVDLPSAARSVVFDGARLRVFSDSGLSVVTLVRFGRTCVLAAATTRDAVLALAAAPIRDQL